MKTLAVKNTKPVRLDMEFADYLKEFSAKNKISIPKASSEVFKEFKNSLSKDKKILRELKF